MINEVVVQFRREQKVNTHAVNMLFEIILHFVKVIKKLARVQEEHNIFRIKKL